MGFLIVFGFMVGLVFQAYGWQIALSTVAIIYAVETKP